MPMTLLIHVVALSFLHHLVRHHLLILVSTWLLETHLAKWTLTTHRWHHELLAHVWLILHHSILLAKSFEWLIYVLLTIHTITWIVLWIVDHVSLISRAHILPTWLSKLLLERLLLIHHLILIHSFHVLIEVLGHLGTSLWIWLRLHPILVLLLVPISLWIAIRIARHSRLLHLVISFLLAPERLWFVRTVVLLVKRT